jgi:hypothetical protein
MPIYVFIIISYSIFLEYTFGEWRLDNETGKRERQITYKTITQSILGTNTLTCREKQVGLFNLILVKYHFVIHIGIRC